MIKFASCISTFLATLSLALDYNYNNNGLDWVTVDPFCFNGTQQSPLNLKTKSSNPDGMKIRGFDYANFALNDGFSTVDNPSWSTDVSNNPDAELFVYFPEVDLNDF